MFPSVPSSMPNFTPIFATCRPGGAKKAQNRPLSNLNNRRFALRAMLPVNNNASPDAAAVAASVVAAAAGFSSL